MPPSKRAPRTTSRRPTNGTSPVPEVEKAAGAAERAGAAGTDQDGSPRKATPTKARRGSAAGRAIAGTPTAGAPTRAATPRKRSATAVPVAPAAEAKAARAASPRKRATRVAPVAPAAEVAQAARAATPRKRNSPAATVAPAAEVAQVARAAAEAGDRDAAPDGTASRDGVARPGGAGAGAAGAFRSEQDPAVLRAEGRAARDSVRRQDLGSWSPQPDRPDPLDLIAATNADRLPQLVPLRWARMLVSPFAYLRGAAAVMASDTADAPTSGLQAQICGDAHVANFGLFGSRERQQVLDVNDFDESVQGPWEFDVRRLATSIVVAGRVAGIKEKACRSAVTDAVRVYREVVHALADLPALTAWSASLDRELSPHIGLDDLRPVLKAVAGKARRNTSVRAAQRMAARDADGGWRFRADPPTLTRVPEEEAAAVIGGLEAYAETLPAARQVLLRRFRPVDVALRVGGLGSIGLRTYAVLLHGTGTNDPLVLQVKEARVPTISSWVGRAEPERHQGERIVAAQQLMQTASDPMLGWTSIDGRDYLVRQFRDMKGSVEATRLKKRQIDDYGRLVGALLARSHCRSIDPRLLAGYLGRGRQLDEAMVEFALRYADQTKQDHEALVQAADEGRIATG